MLTFEHQAGEGPLFAGERPTVSVGGAMQYGARRGIWNILPELLENGRSKATFFVLGMTAEKYPETVQAAARAGMRLPAGLQLRFDPDRERRARRANVAALPERLEDIAAVKIRGWRCPDCRVSPETLDILAVKSMVWDSSLLNDDLPYLFQTGAKNCRIPFTTSTADKTYSGHPYPQRGGPDGLASVWNNELDVLLYQESEKLRV